MGENGLGNAIHRSRRGRNVIPPYYADRGELVIQLGAIRFDRDVRGVANYLASHTDFGGPREKFVRLQQMATTLNLGAVSTSQSNEGLV